MPEEGTTTVGLCDNMPLLDEVVVIFEYTESLTFKPVLTGNAVNIIVGTFLEELFSSVVETLWVVVKVVAEAVLLRIAEVFVNDVRSVLVTLLSMVSSEARTKA